MRRLCPATGEETGGFEAPLSPKGEFEGKVLLTEQSLDAKTLELSPLSPGRPGRVLGGILYGSKRVAESPGRDLAARDLNTQEDLWCVPVGADLRKESVLAVGEATVAFHGEGTEAGKKWLVFRDRETGLEKWRKPTGDSLGQTWPLVISHGLVFHWDRSRLIAHDADSGDVEWRFKNETRENSNLVLLGDHLYFATVEKSGKSTLRGLLAKSGQPVWAEKLEARSVGYALGAIGGRLLAKVGKKVTCWQPNA